jgi:hypothetical protein
MIHRSPIRLHFENKPIKRNVSNWTAYDFVYVYFYYFIYNTEKIWNIPDRLAKPPNLRVFLVGIFKIEPKRSLSRFLSLLKKTVNMGKTELIKRNFLQPLDR